MSSQERVRWGWLRFMYAYTIVGAGVMGVALVVAPDRTVALFGWPAQEPVVLGVMASLYVAFGIVAVLGLRAPLKFAPILCVQLTYKVVWFVGVLVPMVAAGAVPGHALVFVAIFASYVIGDLIAIPFWYVLGPQDAGGQPTGQQA
jgi:hypothetical protein